MKKAIDRSLTNRFKEYRFFLQTNCSFDAVSRLAEIFNCLPRLDDEIRLKWVSRIEAEELPREVVQQTATTLNENVERIRRILLVGSVWNEDEILLILTLRVEIEMVLSFFSEKLSIPLAVPLRDIDAKIQELGESTRHRRDYELTVKLMRKNWGLPIESRWLGAP